ncbi:MAG: ABC transporter permease [Caulobacterales bacterium]|uniref:ABC transporter permease n=1 Tax=Glycocaulis sp. TaxID=1969725 RepID=UPI003FA0DE1F
MLANLVSLALLALRARPLRALLMALTLGAGTAAVSLAAAVLTGYSEQIERLAFGAYARSLVVTENWASPQRSGPPTTADITRIRETLGARIEGVAAWRMTMSDVRYGAEAREMFLYGVSGDYRFELDTPMAEGRLFTAEELEGASRVCLLGAAAARDLYRAERTRIGRQVRVNGIGCEVIGIFETPQVRTADRYDEAVIVPFLASMRYYEAGATRLAPNEADQVTVVLRDRRMLRPSVSDADRVLRRARGSPISQPPPFRFSDASAPAQAVQRQRASAGALLVVVAVISLLAALIGYASSTLSNVEMRRRDIALQMSSGAGGLDILAQIILESLILGLAGAAFGAAVSFGAGQILEHGFGIPVIHDTRVVVLTGIVGIAAGLVAGALPAWKASRLPPALAVRQ